MTSTTLPGLPVPPPGYADSTDGGFNSGTGGAGGSGTSQAAAQVALPVDSDLALWDPPEMAQAGVLIVTSNSLVKPPWEAEHLYTDGDIVEPTTPNGDFYRAAIAGVTGTTGGTEPSWGSFASVSSTISLADNTITWGTRNPLVTADGLWAAGHAFSNGTADHFIIANGRAWRALSGGTTGSTEPDWASAPNWDDHVTDNDFEWRNEGPCAVWSADATYHLRPGDQYLWALPTNPSAVGTMSGTYSGSLSDTTAMSGPTEPPTWPTDSTAIEDNTFQWQDLGTSTGQAATISAIADPGTARSLLVVNNGPEQLAFQPGGSGATAILDPSGYGLASMSPGYVLGFFHTADGWVMGRYWGS